jgi:hypothetical protein
MAPDDVDLQAIEDEYEHRHSWWSWMPADERAGFTKAELEQDADTLAKLTKRGERRELFRDDRTCYRWPQGCGNCIARLLDDDELIAYLVPDPSKPRSARRSGITYIAQQLHADPAFDIGAYIAAKAKEAADRELHKADPPKAVKPKRPKRDNGAEMATSEDEQSVSPETDEPFSSEPPQEPPDEESPIPEAWRWHSQRDRPWYKGIFGSQV